MSASPTTPLRVALFGYGVSGQVFHAPLVGAEPDLEVAAVVTRGPGAASEAAARDLPGVPVLHSPEDVWARAGEFDLAVVATPNSAHYSLASEALRAGLPVVVDKPITRTAAEALELQALADERGLLLSAFQNRRWDADFLTIRSLVAEGRLGTVLRFESRFPDRWRPEPKGGWRESGGLDVAAGHLYDFGPHLVDQAIQLLGPVTSVYADLATRRKGVAADDDTFLALTHEGGARSHLYMSSLTAQAGPRFRVLGDRAAYVKEGWDPQEAALRAGLRPEVSGVPWGTEEPSRWGLLGVGDEAEPFATVPGDWPAYYRGIAAAVRGRGANPVTVESVVPVLRVLEEAAAGF